MSENIARNILVALRSGVVPDEGFDRIVVGLDREVAAITAQLDRVATGYGDFKFIRGDYGAGKTFFTSMAMDKALERNFLVSNVVISTDTPLDRLDVIYRRFVSNLRSRGQSGGVIQSLIERWIFQIEERVIEGDSLEEDDPRVIERTMGEIEGVLKEISAIHSGFAAAVRGYYRAAVDDRYQTAQALIGWVCGEQNTDDRILNEAGIRGFVDPTLAFPFMNAIGIVARQAGHPGVILCLDEVETIQRMDMLEREKGLNNIRQIVDALVANQLPNYYLMFTGTPGFFDDEKGVPSLPPLNQRVRLADPDSEFPNYDHPQLVLKKFNRDKLSLVAEKVRGVYIEAFPGTDVGRAGPRFVEQLIGSLSEKFGGDVSVTPRAFLMMWVDVLDRIRQHPEYDPSAHYNFATEVEARVDTFAREVKALGRCDIGPSGVARFYFDRNRRTPQQVVEGRDAPDFDFAVGGDGAVAISPVTPIAEPGDKEAAHFDLSKFISVGNDRQPEDDAPSSGTKPLPRIDDNRARGVGDATATPSEPIVPDEAATQKTQPMRVDEFKQELGRTAGAANTPGPDFDLGAIGKPRTPVPAPNVPKKRERDDSALSALRTPEVKKHVVPPPQAGRPPVPTAHPQTDRPAPPRPPKPGQRPAQPAPQTPPQPAARKPVPDKPQPASQGTPQSSPGPTPQPAPARTPPRTPPQAPAREQAPNVVKPPAAPPAGKEQKTVFEEPQQVSFFDKLFGKKREVDKLKEDTLQSKADERMKKLLGSKPKKPDEKG